ncbi:MAG: hypothetical protein ACRDAP_15405, partial [Shewanella sp.]
AADQVLLPRRPTFLERMVAGVRNVLESPLTVAGIIAGAAVAVPVLSWLFGGSSSSNSLTSGNLPDFGGPPPPTLDPTQNNGPILLGPNGPPIPTLEEILANAGYPAQEQAALLNGDGQGEQAEPPAPLPPCPEEVGFVVAESSSSAGTSPSPPSQTRAMLNNGDTGNFCSGPVPRVFLLPAAVGQRRFLCRDTETQRQTTSCSINDPAHPCPPGEELEQCTGLRMLNWAQEAAGGCMRACALEKDIVIVLEDTHYPQNAGAAASPQEAELFDAEIQHFCHEGTEIYSEDTPFVGASDYAQERIQFRSGPEDILGRRHRARYREQREAHPRTQQAEDTAQEEAQTAAQPPNGNEAESNPSSNSPSQEKTQSGKADSDKAEQ